MVDRPRKKADWNLSIQPSFLNKRNSGLSDAFLISGLSGCRSLGLLDARLRSADVAANGVLADFVDYDFLGHTRTGNVEEDRFIECTILLFKTLVFHGHGEAGLVALHVYALEFDGNVAYLLWLVLAGDGEFDIIAFALAAQRVDFVVVTGDQCT